MHNNLTTRIYEDESVFEYLKNEWQELAQISNQTIFMSPMWLENWWNIFGKNPNRSLFIVALFDDDDTLVAIFPLHKGITSIFGYETSRRLQLLGSGGNKNETLGYTDFYGICDFLDFAVRPGYEAAAARYFDDFIRTEHLADFEIHFINIPEDSFIYTYIFPLLKKKDDSFLPEATDVCPYIEIKNPKSLGDFIKDIDSGSARRRLRQCLKAQKPKTEPGYKIEAINDNKSIQKAIEAIIELHQKRWNMLGYTGIFFDERFGAFFKRIVFQAHDRGELWMKQVIDESGVCAVRMLLRYNGRYYDYISGFSDSCPSSKYRPGIALLVELVDDALQEGITRIELLRGEEPYKYDFTDKKFMNYRGVLAERKVKNALSKSLTKVVAKTYNHCNKELRLIRVQYMNNGLLRTPFSYLQFRSKRLTEKFK